MSDKPDDRLTRIEESMLFTDRRVEELHEHVLALSGQVDALSRRADRLETLLLRLNEDGEGQASRESSD